MVLYTLASPNNNFIYSIMGHVVYPAQKFCGDIQKYSKDFNYQFMEKEKLKEENENLKTEINKLQNNVVDYYNLKRENLRLKKFYGIKDSDSSLKFVLASVIGRDATEVFGDFTIDQGTESGISINDAVITENGLVGKVCQVNKSFSKVKTILSPDVKIAAINSRTNESGMISGALEYAGSNLTRMIFIPARNDMKNGDILTTSGISGMYPKNLKIGTVKATEYDSRENLHYALVDVFEKITDISDVFVVTDFHGKGFIDSSNGNS